MRALLNWSGALAGLLLLITGGLLQPAWLQWSEATGLHSINLGVTAQLPALLLTALICGPRPAFMAAIAYLAGIAVQLPFLSSAIYTGPFAASIGGMDIGWLLAPIVTGVLHLGLGAGKSERTAEVAAPAMVTPR